MTDFETYPAAMAPVWNNNGWSQGTNAADFLEGEAWGDWNGSMVVGILGIGFGGTPIGQRIDVMTFTENGQDLAAVSTMDLPIDSGRFRSLVQGPDGALYALLEEGSIVKLMPQ